MNWIEVTTAKNEKELINVESILKISYFEESDLTMIEFIRGAYPATFVKGNIVSNIRKFLASKDNGIARTGE